LIVILELQQVIDGIILMLAGVIQGISALMAAFMRETDDSLQVILFLLVIAFASGGLCFLWVFGTEVIPTYPIWMFNPWFGFFVGLVVVFVVLLLILELAD
jgi:hypothetical protein